jgi:hypothetical protein
VSILRGGDVGLGDDLDERDAGAIEIDEGALRLMEQLARVFFHVDAADADLADAAVGGDRLVELRDLVPLRQIGIEVVLAREDGALVHQAAGGERDPHRQLDRLAIEHRQRARVAETDRADVRVRRRAERRRTSAEDLRRGQESGVDLETDDRFVGRHRRGGLYES